MNLFHLFSRDGSGLKSILFTFIPFAVKACVKKYGTFDQVLNLHESPFVNTETSLIFFITFYFKTRQRTLGKCH